MALKKIYIFGLLGLISLVVACGPAAKTQVPTVQMTISPTPPQDEVTLLPSVSPSAPDRTLFFSLSPTLTPTPIIPQEARLLVQCLETTGPQDFYGIGTMVLWNQAKGEAQFLDMSTGTRGMLPNNWHGYDWVISSNERQLAHFTSEPSNRLEFMTWNGDKQGMLDWKSGWIFLGWVDDKNVLIGPEPQDFEYSTTLLVNIATQRQTKLSFGPILNLEDKQEYWPLVYDPTLKYVAYPDYGGTVTGFVLADAETGKILAAVPATLRGIYAPQWFPDGTQVVVAGAADFSSPLTGSELYSLGIDGQVVKLTNFSAYYSGARVDRYSLSSDGRYIAFWLRRDREYISILDTQTMLATNFCIPGLDQFDGADNPLWSPDSNQVAVESCAADSSTQCHTIVVDITQVKAALIAENSKPLFWLKTIPSTWPESP